MHWSNLSFSTKQRPFVQKFLLDTKTSLWFFLNVPLIAETSQWNLY